MTLTSLQKQRWFQIAAGLLLLVYVALRIQIFFNAREIRKIQAELDQMRPRVIQAVEAKEYQLLLRAHQQFIDQLRGSTVDWPEKMQRLSALLPPSFLIQTMTLEGSKIVLQGVLRHPPAEPESYLAKISGALKSAGVFSEVTVGVAPPQIDDPSVMRVELTGQIKVKR